MEKDQKKEFGERLTYHSYFRQYDPGIGRWFSVDPARGSYPGQSPYSFSLNSPIILNDPFGDCPTGDCDDYNNFSGGGRVSIPSNSTSIIAYANRDLHSFTYDGQNYSWNSQEGVYATADGSIYSEYNAGLDGSLSQPRYYRKAFSEAQSSEWQFPTTYIMHDEVNGDKYARVAYIDEEDAIVRSPNIYYASLFPDVGV